MNQEVTKLRIEKQDGSITTFQIVDDDTFYQEIKVGECFLINDMTDEMEVRLAMEEIYLKGVIKVRPWNGEEFGLPVLYPIGNLKRIYYDNDNI